MVFHPDLGYVEDGVDLTDADLYKSAAQPFGQATILPPFSYQSKIFSDLEDEKLWTRSWIAVGTTQQIPNPGDLLPFTVGRHGIHVQREENGDLVGRFNKAQHGGCRAIPLQCQTGKKTKCSFTSCGYSRDQHVIPVEEIGENTPTMHQYLGLIPERLLPIKVETLGPFIFVNLDQDSRSLLESIGTLPGTVDLSSIAQQNWQAEQWFECQSNWKLAGRAFFETENSSENLLIDEHSTANHYVLANTSAPELSKAQASDTDENKIFWLFPNLLVISTFEYTFSVILQPTSMGESLLRVCMYDKKNSTTVEEKIPQPVQQYIETVLARAESYQQATDKLTCPGAPELTEEMIPLEKNIAGYVFQQYITKQIVAEHEYFWNAPLYRINPVA